MPAPTPAASRVWILAVAYAVSTVAVTWPLGIRMATSLAGDYGDSAFVAWVMAWVGDHLTAVAGGDPGAWAAMWQAPIFAPAPDALTFSEHFLAQSVQALPFLWLTGNPLVGYNVVFLATLALTGLAAHLLTFHLSGSHVAGAAAGLTCTFNDYRFIWSLTHLHTLSIHWWILALWGFDRYVATGARGALIGATLALAALNFSSNYLLAYCAPFTAAFCLWSLHRHERLADRRAWCGLAAAGLVSVVSVVPIALRYLATRDALHVTRTAQEVAGSSASIAAYRDALPWIGPLATLALVGVLAPQASRLTSRAKWGLAALALAAVALSFGPVVTIGDVTLTGPYAWLGRLLPGFDGLRVPHRFVAIATVFLTVLAGVGGAWLVRWRLGVLAVGLAVALTTRTAWSRPFPIDVPLIAAPLAQPPAYLRPSPDQPPIYRVVATTPADAIVAELPFGTIAYEIRYTFFTRAHGRRILNGYSGVLPPAYTAHQAALRAPLADAAWAWASLAPATHVVVHTSAWPDDTGTRVRDWLEQHGAHPLADVDGAWLYELPSR